MKTQVNIATVIDESRIGPFQSLVFLLCFLVVLCDGFDTQALAYVAPVLASEWGVPLALFGPVFASVLLGGMFGAFAFGYIADRMGRRLTLIVSVSLFGAISIASAFADSLEVLAALRFACGIGLGGAIPNVMALVSEYAPARRRRTLVAITLAAFAVGAVVAGLVTVPLISRFGWRFIFVVGGILPLCLVPLLVVALPESLKFLMAMPDGKRRIASILPRIDPCGKFETAGKIVVDDEDLPKGALLSLFRGGLAIGSACLPLAFFASLLLVYLITSWTPLLLHQAGLPLQDAVMAAIVFNLSGIAGGIVCTQLIDRGLVRPGVVLVVAYLAGALAVFCIGLVDMAFEPIIAAIFVSGFCVIGGQLSLNAHIANYYPTAIRATGIGWSQMVGRLGSLLGPLVGGALVAWGIPPRQLFQISSIAPLLSCLALLLFVLRDRRQAEGEGAAAGHARRRVVVL